LLIKKSQSVDYAEVSELYDRDNYDEDKINEDLDVYPLSFKLPTNESDIINTYVTGDPEIVQILAKDTEKNIIVMATWNIDGNDDTSNDKEHSMFQIKSDHEEPETLFIRGIQNGNAESQKVI
jgi:hypothetical protein